jgi:hypothetical protein
VALLCRHLNGTCSTLWFSTRTGGLHVNSCAAAGTTACFLIDTTSYLVAAGCSALILGILPAAAAHRMPGRQPSLQQRLRWVLCRSGRCRHWHPSTCCCHVTCLQLHSSMWWAAQQTSDIVKWTTAGLTAPAASQRCSSCSTAGTLRQPPRSKTAAARGPASCSSGCRWTSMSWAMKPATSQL